MRGVMVALACLVCVSHMRAQGVRPSPPESPAATDESSPATSVRSAGTTGTFRSGVDLVSLNVIVTDAKDKFVPGLRQQDFWVYEDGVQQDIVFFGASNV